jgi:hypothetical protein
MTNRGAGVSGLGDVRFGGAHVDVAAAALDEGVDERRETRRLDPSGAGQEHDGLGGAVIGRGRGRGRGLGRGGVLGRGRTTGGEHGLEVGYERGGEGVGPPGVVGHRVRRRGGRALGGRRKRGRGTEGGRGRNSRRSGGGKWSAGMGWARLVYGFIRTGPAFRVERGSF